MKRTDVFRGTFLRWGEVVGLRGVTWEDRSMEEFITREENFHEVGAGFSSIIKKKKNEKIKDFFSTGSNEQH